MDETGVRVLECIAEDIHQDPAPGSGLHSHVPVDRLVNIEDDRDIVAFASVCNMV